MKILSHHRKNPALSMLDISRIEAWERKIAATIAGAEALYAAGLTRARRGMRKQKPRFNTSRAVESQVAAAAVRSKSKIIPPYVSGLVIGGQPYESDASHSTAEKWAARLQQVYGPCFHCEPKGNKVLVSRVAEDPPPAPVARRESGVDLQAASVAPVLEQTNTSDIEALRASIRADAVAAGVDARELAP
jgi:hypothetical protein